MDVHACRGSWRSRWPGCGSGGAGPRSRLFGNSQWAGPDRSTGRPQYKYSAWAKYDLGNQYKGALSALQRARPQLRSLSPRRMLKVNHNSNSTPPSLCRAAIPRSPAAKSCLVGPAGAHRASALTHRTAHVSPTGPRRVSARASENGEYNPTFLSSAPETPLSCHRPPLLQFRRSLVS